MATEKGNEESAEGPVGINNAMLKNRDDTHESKLLEQINLISRKGWIPDEWKLSWIRPIPKPGKKSDRPQNTRPISLSSVFCKPMKRLVLARIDWILDDNEGFTRPKRASQSTSTRKSALQLAGKAFLAWISKSTKTRNRKNNGGCQWRSTYQCPLTRCLTLP